MRLPIHTLIATLLALIAPNFDDLLNRDFGWVLPFVAHDEQMTVSMRRSLVPILLRRASFIRLKPRSEMEVSRAKQWLLMCEYARADYKRNTLGK